jgi:spermidine synthase
VGLAIRASRARSHIRVGVIGLGAGTVVMYGRQGDVYRFYEINPLMIEIAKKEFTFLRDAKAKVEIVLGDARLSLEREPSQNFDVLMMDAFSGDSVPVHLLTKEAFALYFRHLKENGVLVVNVTNRHLDLKPVIGRAAEAFGKEAIVVSSKDDRNALFYSCDWVLVTGHREFLENPLIKKAGKRFNVPKGFRIWTDDYSSLYHILK